MKVLNSYSRSEQEQKHRNSHGNRSLSVKPLQANYTTYHSMDSRVQEQELLQLHLLKSKGDSSSIKPKSYDTASDNPILFQNLNQRRNHDLWLTLVTVRTNKTAAHIQISTCRPLNLSQGNFQWSRCDWQKGTQKNRRKLKLQSILSTKNNS